MKLAFSNLIFLLLLNGVVHSKSVQSCSWNSQCRRKMVCRPWGFSKSSGKRCTNKAAIGGTCDSNNDCYSSTCQNFKCTSKNVSKRNLNASCKWNFECLGNLVCRPWKPLKTSLRRCASKGKLKETCVHGNDCFSGKCLKNACVSNKNSFGKTCNWDRDCKSPLVCRIPKLSSPWPLKCLNKLGIGGLCGFNNHSYSGKCINSRCVAENKPSHPSGCTRYSECAPGQICKAKKCVKRSCTGPTCLHKDDCAIGEVCRPCEPWPGSIKHCGSKGSNGAYCTANDQCSFGQVCLANHCV